MLIRIPLKENAKSLNTLKTTKTGALWGLSVFLLQVKKKYIHLGILVPTKGFQVVFTLSIK